MRYRPVGVFLTKRYDIEASALYKLIERRWKRCLSSARFAFALRFRGTPQGG